MMEPIIFPSRIIFKADGIVVREITDPEEVKKWKAALEVLRKRKEEIRKEMIEKAINKSNDI